MAENEKEVTRLNGKLLWYWRSGVEYGSPTLAKQEIVVAEGSDEDQDFKNLPLLVRIRCINYKCSFTFYLSGTPLSH